MKIFFFGNEFLSFLLKQLIEIEIISEDTLKEEFKDSFLITDDNIFKIKGKDLSGFEKIIIFSDKIDTRFFQLNKEKFNIIYFSKEEYVDIFEIISREKKFLKTDSKVILSDIGNEVYIPLRKISYFSYDRVKKKSFVMIDKEKKYLKKSLMELEEVLPERMFKRVERGIILNLRLIKEIDYKEEFILMQDGERIYLGKGILKKIKDITLREYSVL